MKLELKHYLDAFKYKHPVRLSKQGLFNLDLEYSDDRFNGIGYIKSLSVIDDNISGEIRIGNTGADFDFDINDVSDLELILRTLSDLTKEITHNGETFVPIDYFEIGDGENDSFEYDNGNIILIKNLESISRNDSHHDINYVPFSVVEKLLEWHFDIFNLIENNLAIPK